MVRALIPHESPIPFVALIRQYRGSQRDRSVSGGYWPENLLGCDLI